MKIDAAAVEIFTYKELKTLDHTWGQGGGCGGGIDPPDENFRQQPPKNFRGYPLKNFEVLCSKKLQKIWKK